jgi:hypothetical protein
MTAARKNLRLPKSPGTKSRYGDQDWEVRYALNYKRVAGLAHIAVKNKCCNCLRKKSKQVHHVMYQDKDGAIAGRELPGVHIFPLCVDCHKRAHLRDVWIRNRQNPVLGHRNTDEFIRKLKVGYCMLSGEELGDYL